MCWYLAEMLQNFGKAVIWEFGHWARQLTVVWCNGNPQARSADYPRMSELMDALQARSQISAKCCSFSAVSAPIFARKYAFCSIFQNLPDYLAEFFEIW